MCLSCRMQTFFVLVLQDAALLCLSCRTQTFSVLVLQNAALLCVCPAGLISFLCLSCRTQPFSLIVLQDAVFDMNVSLSLGVAQVLVYSPLRSVLSIQEASSSHEGFYLLGSHAYHDLPSRYWRKYNYASNFVDLVRSKTPKVSLYTDQAKCILMENAPCPDFEACFYNGECLY